MTAELRARLILGYDDTERYWYVEITPVTGDRVVDLDEHFATAGAALDAGCKWAIQRGLYPDVQRLAFNVVATSEREKAPAEAGA